MDSKIEEKKKAREQLRRRRRRAIDTAFGDDNVFSTRGFWCAASPSPPLVGSDEPKPVFSAGGQSSAAMREREEVLESLDGAA